MPPIQDTNPEAPSVRRIQESLIALGYRSDDGRELTADGELGPRTRSAVLKFQTERTPEPPTDGMIGPRTMMALARYADYLDSLDDARHPCHVMYGRARDGICQLPPPCPTDNVQRDNVAAALSHAARNAGMENIDHVVSSADGKRIYAVEGDIDSPLKKIAEIDTEKAASTPVQSSMISLAEQPLTPVAMAGPPVMSPPHVAL